MKSNARTALLLTAMLLPACSRGPRPQTPTPANADQAATPQDTGPGAGRGGQGASQPRPYPRVITAEARTVTGLFKAHRIDERLYFEIPQREMDRDMLILGRSTAFQRGRNINVFIHFEREGNRILLRRNAYDVTAAPTANISRAIEAMRSGPIIAAFNVEAWGPDSTAVIEVTRLFTSNVPEITGLNNPQTDRSFIESVAAYPTNIEVEATQTANQPPAPNAGGGGRGGAAQQPQANTARMHYSLYKLPEQPMMPRLHDKRIGYNSIEFIDYGSPAHQAKSFEFIRRFRLEKKDPTAAISDPVKPIVYYIDPATPAWLQPWIKRGIEAWQEAYREAGFSNAILGMLPPSAEEDPDWSMFDARHSMIYWRPSTTENANGGQVVDPRSGEIIKGEVNMYHNVMNLLRNWYFTQVGPLDPRAQSLPLPDSLMGRLVEYVVTHEVGHSIGFPHNMKASAMYPADSVRSATFLRRMGGHVATLMDYSRFNYVAQPVDRIPPELLIPRIGPYDRFVVMWGHKPIPGAKTPQDEWATLDGWSREQDTIPWLRFTTDDSPNDPFDLTEAVGDQDAVKSSTLGLRNLQRVMGMMLSVAEKPGEDYSLLDELYGNAIGQWGRYNGHVAAIVGSAETQEKYGTGRRFMPTSRQRQRDALRYLWENAFRVPAWFLDEDILFRIEAEGQVRRIRQAQASVLNSLFNENRMNRLVEYEALLPAGESYTIADLLSDARNGAWTELSAARVTIDVYRRNLQRAYLEALDRLVNPPAPAPTPAGGGFGEQQQPRYNSDVRPAVRGHLQELDQAVQAAVPKAADGMTRLHLRDVHMEIQRILDPSVAR
jgi:Met-zincin/Domain of unknown function (DUF5117)/Domain of unknown function (DUF5118)